MKWPVQNNAREAIAMVLVALALGSTWWTFSAIQSDRQKLQRRLQDIRTIQDAGRTHAVDRKEIERWLGRGEEKPATLEALIREHLDGVKMDSALREKTESFDGWNLKRYDVRLDDVPPGKLSEFLAECENAIPPVRIVEIQVTTSPDTASPNYSAQLGLAELSR